MTQRILIVNADDFGLTPGVCTGILEAAERGVVTSTSALVTGPAFANHAAALRDSPLGVGGHLCVVGEDRPVLSAAEVPTLVESSGRFPLTWTAFLRRAMSGRVDIDDLRRELSAQLEIAVGAGLRLTHLDSHQNLHLWPPVSTVMFELAAAHGVTRIRVPRSRRLGVSPMGVRALSRVLVARARRHGLRYPDESAGLDEAGGLDAPKMVALIQRLDASGGRSVELATHPGLADDPDRDRYEWGYRWADELDALCSAEVRVAIERTGMRLGNFDDIGDVP